MHSVRIAVLTTSFPLYPGSPSGIFVERLLQHLPTSFSLSVVTPAGQIGETPPPTGRIKVLPFRYGPKRWERLAHEPGGIPVALKTTPLLYLLLPLLIGSMGWNFLKQARKADLLFANWSICGLIAGIIGRMLRRPVVTTVRGEDIARIAHSTIDRWILATVLWLSSKVVTVSDAFARDLQKDFPRSASKIITIPNGVEERFLGVGSERQHAQTETLRLITVASLIPRKGINQLLEALSIARHKDQLRLVVAGDGRERSQLEKLTGEYGLKNQVAFLGAVASVDIPNLLSKADVHVLASHSEGRPNVVLEAMAAGLVNVATDIPGVDELVTDQANGLLFRDGDARQLADILDTLHGDPALRSRLSAAGRAFILNEGLIWPATAASYTRIFESLGEH